MNTDNDAPRPTGKPLVPLVLTGSLIPWNGDDGPVLLYMPGTTDFFLPVFSTEEKLRSTLTQAGVAFECVKHIDDGLEFLASVPRVMDDQRRVRIAVDLWYTPEGRVRFHEVQRESP